MFTELLTWIFLNILSDNPKNVTAEKIRTAFSKLMENVESVVTAAGTGLYKGNIEPASNVPGDPNANIFLIATPGTYINFKKQDGSAIILAENSFGFIFRTDNGFVLNSVIIPQPNMTEVNKAIQRMDDFIRDFAVTLDEEDNPKSALSFEKGNDVLQGFFDQTINGKEIKFPTTQGFLYTNNTVRATNEYLVSFSKNIPVTENYTVTGVVVNTQNNVASLLGVKGSIITNLVEGLSTGAKYTVNVSDSDYDFISIGFINEIPTKIYNETAKIENIDAKKYVDDRLIVLDSFLNPTEDILEELEMPQPNETSGAGINDGWAQYPFEGLYNGVIDASDLVGYDKIKVTGVGQWGGIIVLGGYNNTTNVYDKLAVAKDVNSEVTIDLNKKYEAYVYSRTVGTKFYKIKTEKLPIEKDAVLKAIENGVGSGSKISQKTKAKISYPINLIELNFETTDVLPIDKTTIAKGVFHYTDNAGTSFKKFGTLEVQGSSSAVYPKKNWTFALFNDEALTDSFKLRVGNWAYHSEFVFKSNWIDATHARNILSNKIWEDIVQSRKYFPKRENEVAYIASNTNVGQRFDSGALCHVDGVPAKLFVNGSFYGIGMFNLGKKRENYDLKSSNQNHIQLAAETHANFNSYVAEQWEIRNPKTPDANFTTKINAWFSSNALTGQAFKDNFETNHVLKNAIDFFLLAEFIQSADMYTKNLMLTSWDGIKFYFLPYDMDTTFGLQWDGLSYTGHTGSIRSASFWSKFYTAYSVEIKARYKDLKESGIFTLENVYKHADKMNKTFGLDSFEEEFSRWSVPSNSTIYTSYPQIYQWVEDRLIWMDNQYL